MSKQNAYISYVSEGISLLFVHYPNFTGIAPDNVITQKIQQQLSDPNNYYIRIAETTFKEPTDIYIENHILIYDTNSFNYSCDFLAKLPMLGEVFSLNVSVATGIALYETVRQRTNTI